MPEHFRAERRGRVTIIAFDRPEKRNPLNEASLLELEALLHEIRDDSTTRVLILTAAGTTFCAGADLSEVKGIADPAERARVFAPIGRRRARLIARTVDLLAGLEQPTIAAVNGPAIGGGWSFVLGCDFRIAVESARFWYPEVDLGVPPSPATIGLVVRNAGVALAKRIIIGCHRFDARELMRLGLIDEVVAGDVLMDTALAHAEALAGKNPAAVAVSKATINAFAEGNTPMQTDLIVERK